VRVNFEGGEEMKIKRRTLAGIGFVILCALLYLSIWQAGLLLWISPPPLGEHSVIVSIQPVLTARPTTVLVRYGLPWWAWAAIGAVTLAYSGAVGWFLASRGGVSSKGVPGKRFRERI
jgi:hypothetical protein